MRYLLANSQLVSLLHGMTSHWVHSELDGDLQYHLSAQGTYEGIY